MKARRHRRRCRKRREQRGRRTDRAARRTRQGRGQRRLRRRCHSRRRADAAPSARRIIARPFEFGDIAVPGPPSKPGSGGLHCVRCPRTEHPRRHSAIRRPAGLRGTGSALQGEAVAAIVGTRDFIRGARSSTFPCRGRLCRMRSRSRQASARRAAGPCRAGRQCAGARLRREGRRSVGRRRRRGLEALRNRLRRTRLYRTGSRLRAPRRGPHRDRRACRPHGSRRYRRHPGHRAGKVRIIPTAVGGGFGSARSFDAALVAVAAYA